ncbi:hypothetical protein TrispH2_010510 [Trichoplax sp. H2]|uniref:SUEL-type lectin domain-containing protein n=1 Tax=Trichoplax adhaerens TaxID=10228 RepID=B3S5E8_TRIAD|nr:predicted protein [Trichoplax adhaerens]EDV22026.1 predicted protein [Trichoplax adhaerens]RDD37850.1 hypothetical protein TrispH2_010510 [Trichoplax sp. H2]|eukprot:XP_002115663.1 predicted protein [Trichoplax adhaerens]
MVGSTSIILLVGIAISMCVVDGGHSSHLSALSGHHGLLQEIIDIIKQDSGKVASEEIAYKNPYESFHIIQRRAASPGSVTVWVEGDVNQCVKPSASIMSFCDVNYLVPATIIKRTTKTLHFIISNFNILQRQLSTTCQNSLKDVLCKGTLPKCSSDTKSATYLDFSRSCSGLKTCGSKLVNVNGLNTQAICQSTGQQFTLSTCVKSSLASINSMYCGPLPKDIAFPSWVVPNLYQQSAIIASMKSSYAAAGVSAFCSDKWIKMSCTTIPFCSTDRRKIVSSVTKQQCQSAISCLPTTTQNVLALAWDCNAYPDEKSQKMTMSDSQAYPNGASGLTVNIALLFVIYFLSAVLL